MFKGWNSLEDEIRGPSATGQKLRSIRELRVWMSEGLTRADAESQGVEFLGPEGTSRKLGANDSYRKE